MQINRRFILQNPLDRQVIGRDLRQFFLGAGFQAAPADIKLRVFLNPGFVKILAQWFHDQPQIWRQADSPAVNRAVAAASVQGHQTAHRASTDKRMFPIRQHRQILVYPFL